MGYTKLNIDRKEVRLINLHNGKPGDEVSCHLSITSLGKKETQYEALSYVWGGSNEKRVANIDGDSTPVTDSLWNALNHLRYSDKDRVLWVDALCINQLDIEERSSQVSLMGMIYSEAASVEIWLGESYDGIEVALEFITEVASRRTASGNIPSWGHLEGAFDDEYDHDEIEGDTPPGVAHEAFVLQSSVTKLAESPWFERIWTVQEYFLAKEATFHCGPYTLEGRIFLEFINHTAQHMDELCCEITLPDEMVTHLRYLFRSEHAMRLLRILSVQFLECVGYLRLRKATDPRDKIYGLLGLGITDVSTSIQVDYTQSVEEMYEAFVHSLLRRTKNLHVLSHLRTDFPQNLRLPSFVPDWSMELGYLGDWKSWSFRFSTLDIYNAASGMPVEFEVRPGVLIVRGVIVDTIEMTAARTFDEASQSSGIEEQSSAWNGFLNEVMTVAAISPQEEDPQEDTREAFWLTMVAGCLPRLMNDIQPSHTMPDCYYRLNGIIASFYKGYENVLRKVPGDMLTDAVPPDFYYFNQGFKTAQGSRKFMRTKTGRIGLVPNNAEQGDVVAVLTGGHVPLILRPKNGHYIVVGDAYVHSIMDGEAIPRPEVLDNIELH